MCIKSISISIICIISGLLSYTLIANQYIIGGTLSNFCLVNLLYIFVTVLYIFFSILSYRFTSIFVFLSIFPVLYIISGITPYVEALLVQITITILSDFLIKFIHSRV